MDLPPTQSARELRAELLLLAMERHEELARHSEDETCLLATRQCFEARYRRLVGVHPARRHELRDALERVADGTDAVDGNCLLDALRE